MPAKLAASNGPFGPLVDDAENTTASPGYADAGVVLLSLSLSPAPRYGHVGRGVAMASGSSGDTSA